MKIKTKRDPSMKRRRVYPCLVQAAKTGIIKEQFTVSDFKKACPGFGKGTYKAFLYKHRVVNRGVYSGASGPGIPTGSWPPFGA